VSFNFGAITTKLLNQSSLIKPSQLLQGWHTDVSKEYSRRALSRREDKLHAISGIARAFRARLQTDYVVGLWPNDTAYGLSWAPDIQAKSLLLIVLHHSRGPRWMAGCTCLEAPVRALPALSSSEPFALIMKGSPNLGVYPTVESNLKNSLEAALSGMGS
jgi:hypothetical protein